MTPSSSTDRQMLDDDSIWLLVQRDNRTTSFELPADGHHAIVVGSADNADIRIQGVAPIAFCLEREGHALRLTLAYPEPNLRVDTQRVESSVCIFGQGTVEFGGACLLLRIRDTPPTLRADCRVAVDAELSDPFSAQKFVATSHHAVTRDLDPVNIDAIFEAAIVRPESEEVQVTQLITQPLEPLGEPIAPARIVEAIRVPVPSRVPTESLRPLNVKTVELVPVTMLDVTPALPQAVEVTPERVATPKLEPFRTIEIAPVRLEMITGAQEPSRRQFDALRNAAENTVGGRLRSGQTTSFDVPVLPTQTPERPASIPTGLAASRPPAATAVLARLGMLTKRYPVGVIGGAVLGSLVLLLGLLGAAQLMGVRAGQKVQVASKPSPTASVLPSVMAPPALAHPQPQTVASVAVVGDAIAPTVLDTRGAAGHLFAGRLPEAEQAYQALATNYPEEPAFQAISRILARRNSPGCRVAGSSKASCPTVKP